MTLMPDTLHCADAGSLYLGVRARTFIDTKMVVSPRNPAEKVLRTQQAQRTAAPHLCPVACDMRNPKNQNMELGRV